MKHAAVVLFLAFGAGMVLYPWLIAQLAVSGARQRVQAYNPQSHMIKAGTPTMGGLLFCAIAVVAWLVFDRTRLGFVVVFALGAGALLGVLDDRDNIRGKGVFGLGVREKLVFQAFIGLLVGIGLAAVATIYALPGTQPSTDLIYAPMALDHGLYQPFTVGLAGHVAGHNVGLGNLGLQRLQAPGPPGRQDRDRSAGGQRTGQLLAQAGTRAGDHDDPPGQAGWHISISMFAHLTSIQ